MASKAFNDNLPGIGATDRHPCRSTASLHETREWFTAAELAELDLPGLPSDKRSINRRAQAERWTIKQGADGSLLVRPRAGRGGGVEFHVSLLPGEARLELARRGICGAPAPEEAANTAEGSWRWFDAQTERVKGEAQRRLEAVNEVLLLEESGLTRTAAIGEIAPRRKVSTSTMWGWLRLIDGVAPADRLPALAPRHKGGGREAEIDGFLWNLFKSDWLRVECPTLTSCYDRTAAIAAQRGLSMPSERSIRRKIERELDPRVVLLARGGREKAERSIPTHRRTLSSLHAMDIVNIDGHQFDVFVMPPESGATPIRPAKAKPCRPVLIAIQDVFSRKILSWKLDLSENFLATRLAFADLFEEHGIPNQCLLDNSRTFAGKSLTGGAQTRYRYKVREEEAAGLLVSLGVKIRFAQIYHGQSKPIERAFRDIADRVARAPACAGAYTGNSPANKPANYGKRAVPWAEFEAIVAQGIADHNARLGRRTETARGRSFDQTFAESYAASAIRKAAPEQLRMALLAAEQKRVNRRTGEIELYGNRYWHPDCGRYLGELVTVRFDPENLHKQVHIYAASDGRYLTAADLIQDYGFADAAGAVAAKKRRKQQMQTIRAGLEAERLLAAERVAELQESAPAPAPVEAAAIRPVRPKSTVAAALKPQTQPNPAHDRQARVFEALRLVGEDE